MSPTSFVIILTIIFGCGTTDTSSDVPSGPEPISIPPTVTEPPPVAVPGPQTQETKIGGAAMENCLTEVFAALPRSKPNWLSVGSQLHSKCQVSPLDLQRIGQNIGEYYYESSN